MTIIRACLVIFIMLSSVLLAVESKYMVYDTKPRIVHGKLNVHLVPHCHDDVGWLKTIDEYYVGSNNSIQGACVQNVLDSLVPALLADKNRRFVYVEQAFFQRWWREQSEAIQTTVKHLVSSGQLELINGGICIHDEAAPQTTLGHRFIKQVFNVTPRIGWHIDPFGHSAVRAYLLGAEVGFDSLFFARIDYQDRAKRKYEKGLEVIWQGSKSLQSSAQVINENVAVLDLKDNVIESQLLPIASASIGIRNFYTTAYLGRSPSVTPKYWLAFTASVPPLGFSTYVVSTTKRAAATSVRQKSYKTERNENDTVEVVPGNLKLIYSGNKGKLTQYVNSGSSIKASVEQSYIYYDGATGDLQADGAYIFRPNGTFSVDFKGKAILAVLRGPLYDEVHQSISSWIYQITRVYKGKEHAEVEFIVGPIPIDDGIGKDIVTKITTAMKSNKTFYTDSNGCDFLQRIYLGIYMKDDSTELSILVDRSVGGSSIIDGQLELMLLRRLLHDDGRGVAEALNETVCAFDNCTGLIIQGKYYLRIDPLGEGAQWRRSYGQEIYSPLLLAFTEQDGDKWTNFQVPTFSCMDPSYSLLIILQ